MTVSEVEGVTMDGNDIQAWLKEEAVKRQREVQAAQERLQEEQRILRERQEPDDDDPVGGLEGTPREALDLLAFIKENLPPGVTVQEATVLSDTQRDIADVLDGFKAFLIKKNEQYGDSAVEPVRVFSQATDEEQLLVRMDDKLSRLVRGNSSIEPDEDIMWDLLGYWILLQVVRRKAARADA